MYIYYNFLIHLSIHGNLGCFQVLAIVNNAVMNTGVHVSFSMPSSGITGLYDSFIPSFFFKGISILFSILLGISLHSHEEYKRIPFCPHPLQHLLFVDFLTMTMLTSVR